MICLATNLVGVHDGFIQVFNYYYIVTVKIYQVTIVINIIEIDNQYPFYHLDNRHADGKGF